MTQKRDVIVPRRSLDALRVFLVRQRWQQPNIEDIPKAVNGALQDAGALERIAPGSRIAITAGSRGIATMPAVLKAVVRAVRDRGGEPFLFPAMGSHGGGTAEGQMAVLAGLGIDEKTMGAPIRATMEVVQIGQSASGLPVYLDAIAAEADGIIIVNRVKKHTNYDGPIESGLAKMAVIGMGKHRQAVVVHQYGNFGLREYIPEVARVVMEKAPVLAGLALIENAWGGLADLVGVKPSEIVNREPALLRRAKELCAKIPFHEVDIAIVEQIGKDISGTGMDCYVIGRKRIIGEPEWPEAPQISSLVALDLTEATHGSAVGIGLADFTTRRLANKIDWVATQANVLTSGNMERAKLPFVFETDRLAIEAAGFRERLKPLETLRVVAMRDTLRLSHLLVSEPLAREAEARAELEIVSGPMPLPFDVDGNWVSPFDEVLGKKRG